MGHDKGRQGVTGRHLKNTNRQFCGKIIFTFLCGLYGMIETAKTARRTIRLLDGGQAEGCEVVFEGDRSGNQDLNHQEIRESQR